MHLFSVPRPSWGGGRGAAGFLNLEIWLQVVKLIKLVELSQDSRVRSRDETPSTREMGTKRLGTESRTKGTQLKPQTRKAEVQPCFPPHVPMWGWELRFLLGSFVPANPLSGGENDSPFYG